MIARSDVVGGCGIFGVVVCEPCVAATDHKHKVRTSIPRYNISIDGDRPKAKLNNRHEELTEGWYGQNYYQ